MRAKDAPRNQLDPTPASFTWNVVDGTAPQTTITSVQSGSTIFTFSGSDNHSQESALTFQCQPRHRRRSLSCTSPKTYTGLAAGSHTFEVRAIDQAGNVDASPAEPYVERRRHDAARHEHHLSQPTNPTTSTSASFGIGGTDNFTAPAALTFECRIDSTVPGDWATLHQPEGVPRPRASARTPSRCGRSTGPASGPEPRDVHVVDHLGRHDGARHEHRHEAAADDDGHERLVHLLLAGDRRDLRVQARRGRAGSPPARSRRPTPVSRSASTPSRCARPTRRSNIDLTPASYTWAVQSPAPPAELRQPGHADGNADAWIDQGSPTANKGGDSILKVMSKSGGNLRALVRFLLPEHAGRLQGRHRDPAPLRRPRRRTAGRSRRSGSHDAWSENTVTWGNAPATIGTAATASSGSRLSRVERRRATSQAMYDSGAHNGLLIRDASENQDAEQQFHSREKGSNLPQLVLKFTPARRAAAAADGHDAAGDDDPLGPVRSDERARTASFEFTASETGSTFECRLDSTQPSRRSTPARARRRTPGLAGSARTASRCARSDAAGNIDQTPALWTWTITTAPVDTTAAADDDRLRPDRRRRPARARPSRSPPARPASTFECKLDTALRRAARRRDADGARASAPTPSRCARQMRRGTRIRRPRAGRWTVEPPPPPNCGSAATVGADADAWIDQG